MIRGKITSLGDLHILQRSRGQSTRKYCDVDRRSRRLSSSTFLITGWVDLFIYAKIVPPAQNLLILDTGCGGESSNSRIGVQSLRIHRGCYR
ncbi:hypothetical protein EDC04DRAFT_2778864 [Pisolithus marmoratus]|nr:hypothetical protein EDC04DRAFT_2778864 [Pisolithus marmoratus]